MSNKSKLKDRQLADGQVETHTDTAAEEAVQATQESLDQVRDILFGSQMRDHDRRFEGLEAKVGSDLAAFREETQQTLSSLESFIKSEFASLAQRVTNEANQRGEAIQAARGENQNAQRALADQWQSAAQALEKRVAGFDQHHENANSELRKQLLEQTTTLHSEIKSSQAQLQMTIEKLVADLANAKTDRSTLANLLTEMAGKLQS